MLMVGFGIVLAVGIAAIFLLIVLEFRDSTALRDLITPYVMAPFAASEVFPLLLLSAGLWRLLRREQIVVDLHEVAMRRRWLFWQTAWHQPINGYDGLMRLRVRRRSFWERTSWNSSWFVASDIIVLRHAEPGRSVVLAAAAPGAEADALWRYYRQFLPAVGERDPLGTFESIWLKAPQRDDVSPAPAIANPDLPGDPVKGRWDRAGVIWSVLCTIAAGPVLIGWGPAAVGLLIAGSAIPPLIRGKAFFFWRTQFDAYTVARFLEGLQARAYAVLVLLLGIGWYAWFASDFPIGDWVSPWQSMQRFRDMDALLRSSRH